MGYFDDAMSRWKDEIVNELEQRIWEKLEPRIRQELNARHMSVYDTAEYLHVSHQTVRRLLADGEIPHFRIRQQIFVRQSDVDAWIEKQIRKDDR